VGERGIRPPPPVQSQQHCCSSTDEVGHIMLLRVLTLSTLLATAAAAAAPVPPAPAKRFSSREVTVSTTCHMSSSNVLFLRMPCSSVCSDVTLGDDAESQRLALLCALIATLSAPEPPRLNIPWHLWLRRIDSISLGRQQAAALTARSVAEDHLPNLDLTSTARDATQKQNGQKSRNTSKPAVAFDTLIVTTLATLVHSQT